MGVTPITLRKKQNEVAHGQQELAFYNHHYRSQCYLLLFIFEGLSCKLVTAALRAGTHGTQVSVVLGGFMKHPR